MLSVTGDFFFSFFFSLYFRLTTLSVDANSEPTCVVLLIVMLGSVDVASC